MISKTITCSDWLDVMVQLEEDDGESELKTSILDGIRRATDAAESWNEQVTLEFSTEEWDILQDSYDYTMQEMPAVEAAE